MHFLKKRVLDIFSINRAPYYLILNNTKLLLNFSGTIFRYSFNIEEIGFFLLISYLSYLISFNSIPSSLILIGIKTAYLILNFSNTLFLQV